MRPLWFVAGIVATAVGLVGVVVPVLPTTPFLLLAAFAFARSSPRLYAWLVNHPRFGPPIRDWRRHGAIGPRAKAIAVATMAVSLAASAAAGLRPMILAIQASALVAAAAFILTRPSPPPEPED